MANRGRSWAPLCAALLACGPSVPVDDGDGSDDSGGDPSTTSSSATASDTTAVVDSSGPGDGDGDVTTQSADTSEEGPTTFDVGSIPDAGTVDPPCEGEALGSEAVGAIWIANSMEGTVSKVDVETLFELGRYITRPDGNGNPSRTSVNRNGDVAVANRSGGVVMIRGDVDDCLDPTNTSGGAGDIRPWPDGCVGWYTAMAYASQRPVAWMAGTFDTEACRYVDMDVWTAGANADVDVLLLDGETGAIEQTIPVPGVVASYYGIYGGAVDSGNHFWGSQLGGQALVRVDAVSFEPEVWEVPVSTYGMTVDRNDRVWVCGYESGRFDYPTETWETALVGGQGGCAPGNDNVLWLANQPIVGVDIDTLAVVAELYVPEYVHGVSMDFDGNVWGVALAQPNAYRIDPETGAYDLITGFVAPYTYSDMTGTALAIVNGQL
jgi:hypothetical protein